MARSHAFGTRGEELAASYLTSRGYRILDRNWRFHHKELDLVVERDGMVAFVEVKARDSGGWGHPLDGIGWRKRRDLLAAARGWIVKKGRREWSYRFDAVVVVRDGHGLRLDHVEDAWRV